MKILLTGATGLLGAATAARLSATSHQLTCAWHHQPLPLATPSVQLDMDDLHSLRRAFHGQDLVLHCARPPLERAWTPDQALATGVSQVRHLLQACRDADVRRLLYVGPASALGHSTHRPLTELDDHLPGDGPDPLADVAWAMESEVLAANSLRLATTSLLLTHLFGPQPPTTRLARLLHTIAHTRLPLPEASLNVTDLREVSKALLTALQRARPGQRYLLGGNPLSLRDIAALVHQTTDAPTAPTTPLHLPTLPTGLKPLLQRAGSLAQPLADLLTTLGSLPTLTDSHKAHLELAYEARHPPLTLLDTLAHLKDGGHL